MLPIVSRSLVDPITTHVNEKREPFMTVSCTIDSKTFKSLDQSFTFHVNARSFGSEEAICEAEVLSSFVDFSDASGNILSDINVTHIEP